MNVTRYNSSIQTITKRVAGVYPPLIEEHLSQPHLLQLNEYKLEKIWKNTYFLISLCASASMLIPELLIETKILPKNLC